MKQNKPNRTEMNQMNILFDMTVVPAINIMYPLFLLFLYTYTPTDTVWYWELTVIYPPVVSVHVYSDRHSVVLGTHSDVSSCSFCTRIPRQTQCGTGNSQ